MNSTGPKASDFTIFTYEYHLLDHFLRPFWRSRKSSIFGSRISRKFSKKRFGNCACPFRHSMEPRKPRSPVHIIENHFPVRCKPQQPKIRKNRPFCVRGIFRVAPCVFFYNGVRNGRFVYAAVHKFQNKKPARQMSKKRTRRYFILNCGPSQLRGSREWRKRGAKIGAEFENQVNHLCQTSLH